MKISLNWLGDHVDVAEYRHDAGGLVRLLTAAGLEVEAVEDRAAQFKNVVVGQIVKLERHPNADRLTVCQVDVGEGGLRQIVCGAKNHKAGDKVVVTLPGAVLPGNFEIKKSKIRDVESLGMLASESELGLKKESEGILILPADAPVGKLFAEYQGFDDVVLDIKVTPNRADCLSHLGLAREISCLLGRPLKTRSRSYQTSERVKTGERIRLHVADAKLCPRYAGRVVENVRVAESPHWLRARLESVGLNSINNVVDVTNYVMMDIGQPMHAFDLAHIHGGQIEVSTAKPGEPFVTLDGRELKLTGDELTIRDGEGPVALAGVIGGKNSGVSDQTKAVFLEAARFTIDSVRKTSRRFGLQTDSAYRFSRGIDPGAVSRALDLACALLREVAGGEVAVDLVDNNPVPLGVPQIEVTAAYVGQRLGYSVSTHELRECLERLGCEVTVTGEVLNVTPPEFRLDLEQDVDLVEEYGRLNGYDKIPAKLPGLNHAPLAADATQLFGRRVAEAARAAGLSQVVNFGFTSAKLQAEWLGEPEAFKAAGLEMDAKAIALKNPISEELGVMRVSLLPGLIKNILHNVRYGNAEGRVFETGQTFAHAEGGYAEHSRFSVAAWGEHVGLWQKATEESKIFFDLKARVQNVLARLQIRQVQFQPWANAPSLLHPAQSATVFVEGRNVGFIGVLHPELAQKEKLRWSVGLAELDLKALGRGQPRPIKFKPVPKFPSVERDLAFVLPPEMRAEDVATEIRKTAGALLQSIEIFDVFKGGTLPENHASVAYRMIYQDTKETLTDEKLTTLQNQIVANVTKKLKVHVR